MSLIFKKYLEKKGLVTSLISGFILLIAGWPLVFYSPFKLISIINHLILRAIEYCFSVLKVAIPIWTIVAALLIFLVGKAIFKLIRSKKDTQNGFLQYREDVFNDVKYKWKYKRLKGQYSIVDIRAYCSSCGCLLPIIECPNPTCRKIYLKRAIGTDAIKNIMALVRYKLMTDFKIDEYERIK